MFKTNASIRRFIALQKHAHPDAPLKAWQRYENYVYCVANAEYPKTFKEWIVS
jgi:hypothetical protein